MRIRSYWLLIFLLLSTGAFVVFKDLQPQITYALAPQFDGNDYQHIYDFFQERTSDYAVSFPFHSRVLVPYLASILAPGDIIQGFLIVNFVFTLLSVIMLFLLWREFKFSQLWILIGFGWLLLHWTGIIRLNLFDPITVDVPLYFFQALFLWLILKRKFIWLLLLGPVATLQKESFIALLVVLLVYGWWHNRKTEEGYYPIKVILLSLVLSIVAKQIVNYYFPPIEAGRGSIVTIAYHFRELIYHPFRLVRWILAFFMAFGPLLFLTFAQAWRHRYYDNRKNLLILFSAVYFLFGILAGGDMTRIIFLGFPFIMSWMLFELRDLPKRTIGVLLLLSLPLTFFYKSIPDPAFEWDLWTTWYPEFAPSPFVLGYAGYLVFCLLITFFLTKKAT